MKKYEDLIRKIVNQFYTQFNWRLHITDFRVTVAGHSLAPRRKVEVFGEGSYRKIYSERVFAVSNKGEISELGVGRIYSDPQYRKDKIEGPDLGTALKKFREKIGDVDCLIKLSSSGGELSPHVVSGVTFIVKGPVMTG